MDITATEQLLQAAKIAKERAKRAEREFDNGSAAIQRKASISIDLFGGSAVSQVADIASDTKKVCDALYASYQTLVKMLDEQCRPLLDQNPDYTAVREVRDLIKWLNDESEISNDFTASLNSQSLGGVASGRYFPSIENKMIQSFWENKYEMLPGREEAEAAKRREDAKNAELRKKEREEKYKEDLTKYEKEYGLWKEKADEIENVRKKELNNALDSAKTTRKSEIEYKYKNAVDSSKKEILICEKKREQEEEKLKSLGFFKLSEKKSTRAFISELTEKINSETKKIETAKETYVEENKNFDSWCEAEKKKLKEKIDNKYPLPPQPRKPFALPNGGNARTEADNLVANSIKEAIVAGMIPGNLYSVTDLMMEIPELDDLPTQRVAAYLRQLMSEGYIERIENARKSYFRLL